MVTFSYIKNNFPRSLDMFINCGENAFLGAAAGSIIEFLGRCLSESPKIPNGQKDFNRFIDKYLSKKDVKYKTHSKLLYGDLRHGSAHNTLSNGGTVLSHSRSQKGNGIAGGIPAAPIFYLSANWQNAFASRKFFWYSISN